MLCGMVSGTLPTFLFLYLSSESSLDFRLRNLEPKKRTPYRVRLRQLLWLRSVHSVTYLLPADRLYLIYALVWLYADLGADEYFPHFS